jgi:hypothetical protein
VPESVEEREEMSELKDWLKKWGTRLIGSGVVGVAVILLLSGLLYDKSRMTLLGAVFAEALWLVWFKPSFGKMEDLDGFKFVGVAILRGLSLVAFILGLTLGL